MSTNLTEAVELLEAELERIILPDVHWAVRTSPTLNIIRGVLFTVPEKYFSPRQGKVAVDLNIDSLMVAGCLPTVTSLVRKRAAALLNDEALLRFAREDAEVEFQKSLL